MAYSSELGGGVVRIGAVKDKVLAVRAVRIIPIQDRWGEDCIKWVNRAPWNHYKGDEYADGDVPEEVTAE